MVTTNDSLICPIRKGGPCVKSGCAWYDEERCAVLGIVIELNDISVELNALAGKLSNGPRNERDFSSVLNNNNIDDDVPF